MGRGGHRLGQKGDDERGNGGKRVTFRVSISVLTSALRCSSHYTNIQTNLWPIDKGCIVPLFTLWMARH